MTQDYGNPDEFGLQKRTFDVIVEFPEDVAGKCVGTEPPRTQDGSTAREGRTLSAVMASPGTPQPFRPSQSQVSRSSSSSQASQSSRVGKQRASDEDEYERIFASIDIDALFAIAADASQKAAIDAVTRLVRSQAPQRSQGVSSPRSRAGAPSASQTLHIREEDFDDDESFERSGNWVYDPSAASNQQQSSRASGSQRPARTYRSGGAESGFGRKRED